MISDVQVLILAGGFGTRMSKLFPDVPKPLIPVAGIPILHRQILECRRYGFDQILLLLHFDAEKIKSYFGDGSAFGVKIYYQIETVPLGTGGALLSVLDYMNDNFLVMYADVYSKVDLQSVVSYHFNHDADLTVVAHPNSHPQDSDILVLKKNNLVTGISAHPHDETTLNRNMVNAAMYVVKKSALSQLNYEKRNFDIAQDVFPLVMNEGLKMYAYVTVEYLKDMGTPKRLTQVERDIQNGVPLARASDNERLAVFIDRDGTLNVESGYVTTPNDLLLLPGVGKALRMLNQSQYLSICITNQPVIARGDTSQKTLHKIHATLDLELAKDGSYLDDLYYCPHHPDRGFDGEIQELKVVCACRKPGTEMFIRAAQDFNISLERSWVIGDRTSDIKAAQSIRSRSILVSTGASGKDKKYLARPSVILPNFSDAVNFILGPAQNFEVILKKITSEITSKKVLFIDGLKYTGKTTLAAHLKWYMSAHGYSAHILDLSRFCSSPDIQPFDRRNSVDLKAAYDFISEFILGNRNTFLDYGEILNKLIYYGKEHIGGQPILLVDGAGAINLSKMFGEEQYSVFVRRNFEDRLASFEKMLNYFDIQGDLKQLRQSYLSLDTGGEDEMKLAHLIFENNF